MSKYALPLCGSFHGITASTEWHNQDWSAFPLYLSWIHLLTHDAFVSAGLLQHFLLLPSTFKIFHRHSVYHIPRHYSDFCDCFCLQHMISDDMSISRYDTIRKVPAFFDCASGLRFPSSFGVQCQRHRVFDHTTEYELINDILPFDQRALLRHLHDAPRYDSPFTALFFDGVCSGGFVSGKLGLYFGLSDGSNCEDCLRRMWVVT